MNVKSKFLRQISVYEQYIMITVGIILMVIGFYYFIIPSELVTSGVTGIGLIFNALLGVQISYIVFVFNIVLLFIGWWLLGKKVFIRSIYGSLMFPFILFLFENFAPMLDIEGDIVIAVVFGGFFLGVGFGYVMKYGGTSGGSDIPVKILNKRLNLPLSKSVYYVDGFIILIGIIVFYSSYGINAGLYAIINVYISGVIADWIVLGSKSKRAVNIITENPEAIKHAIYDSIIRGVTEVKIKGGYTNLDKTMLITVITKQEYYIIRNIVASIDPKSFVYVTGATEIHGDFYERENE